MILLLWAALLASPAAAASRLGGSVQLVAYDADGRALDKARLIDYIARADKRGDPALWAWSPDGLDAARPTLSQNGETLQLSWNGLPRAILSLPWPVKDDGFSTVLVDRDGRGIADGDTIRLNEEIALTQYRLFKEAWIKHVKDMNPRFEPSSKAQRLADTARNAMAAAQAGTDPAGRAKLFESALHEISIAWQKMLVEHGQRLASGKRFGLTIDESLLERLDHYEWIIDSIQRSGSNWARLVFRPNANDFAYASQASFNEYDAIVKELRSRNVRVMGCVLDTAQWPSSLTPEIYAERAKNLALHYKDQINSWEIGNEINGNWLGGQRNPLSPEQAARIFMVAASAVKTLEPALETVLTLYWWEGTAPDEEHSLLGWIKKYGPRGVARDVDIVALSLQPEDNPVGLALERIFESVHLALPDKRLMVGSYGYVEGDELKGFWWLHPSDIDGARKDLITLLTPAACALDGSVGGGFWWQTLDQMLPGKHKVADLYKVYRQTVRRTQ